MTDHPLLWVRTDFGLRLDAIDEVRLGTDAAARLWRGVAPDGAAYAVKLSGGGSPAGLLVAAHLAGHGVPGIARPFPAHDGRPWSERGGRRLSVLPWLAAGRAVDGGMTAAHWASLGEVLAAVHVAPVVAGLPREGYSHRRWAAVLHRVWDRLADPDRLARLLGGADLLAGRLRDRPRRDVVCHGDPHLGNVLVEPDGRVWLIDWDDAVLAPVERDLMFVHSGVPTFAPASPEERAAFSDGYGPVRTDPERIAYHQCVRALEDVLDFVEQGDAASLRIVAGLLSPAGLVTRAEAALLELS